MSLFKRKNNVANSPAAGANLSAGTVASGVPSVAPSHPAETAHLAEIALANIHDGVIITDPAGRIEFINPAAVTMTNCGAIENARGLDYGLVLKIETKDGRELPEAENPVVQVVRTGQPLEGYQARLIANATDKRTPVALSVIPEASGHRIITFRNIAKELAEESEQAEFISTASHEMRTPVATIDGYLALCLNPQTATVDARAHGYLEAAHAASQHLGKLFQDLLDTTKLDDGRIRPQFTPVDLTGVVKQISDSFAPQFATKNLKYQFGAVSPDAATNAPAAHRLDQKVYSYVDVNFLREILGNLLENAIKYTPENGAIFVNVRGDNGRAVISVADTGIGISAEDLAHVFQKFYRADNSDTRTIGGTGLGLYLAKQRTEAMGGRIWAESISGQGSTFFVSLPRLSPEEYEKRMIAIQNMNMVKKVEAPPPQPAAAQPIYQANQGETK